MNKQQAMTRKEAVNAAANKMMNGRNITYIGKDKADVKRFTADLAATLRALSPAGARVDIDAGCDDESVDYRLVDAHGNGVSSMMIGWDTRDRSAGRAAFVIHPSHASHITEIRERYFP